ncbi:unnamed protein product [Protopolystoma xenopodis]|uniref:Uncharacterized protein n=1 Tax=Protopolystoma xenopodis TaxID=117903 RepID=A0A3S5ACC7_9PLAT|nr:unnamed protein product [Protopolystoma xenopodis]
MEDSQLHVSEVSNALQLAQQQLDTARVIQTNLEEALRKNEHEAVHLLTGLAEQLELDLGDSAVTSVEAKMEAVKTRISILLEQRPLAMVIA